ncbi:MAG: endonuclease III [Tannerellaceae bacterium]|jgi:endonuclease-3|nr:endonuclease III [Tannerellaceae bacterium]
MTSKERYSNVLQYFQENNPAPQTELQYSSPFELLMAVMLSAQCTDKRVNLITPELFRQYPTPQALAQASPQQIAQIIRSVSYPNSKAQHLVGMAQQLVSKHNGQIPNDRSELEKLPGVGRKTANVIASVIFHQPAMAVDTHVFRVAARIGLTRNAKTPLAAEQQLTRNIPEQLIPYAHHWLILHGRYICQARQPRCQECQITTYCKHYNSKKTSA